MKKEAEKQPQRPVAAVRLAFELAIRRLLVRRQPAFRPAIGIIGFESFS